MDVTTDATVARLRRMVDWMGGPQGGFTYEDYAQRYGIKDYDAPPDFTKGDVRRALNAYADLLEEMDQQGMERDLLA